jgi:hypothetical protein
MQRSWWPTFVISSDYMYMWSCTSVFFMWWHTTLSCVGVCHNSFVNLQGEGYSFVNLQGKDYGV